MSSAVSSVRAYDQRVCSRACGAELTASKQGKRYVQMLEEKCRFEKGEAVIEYASVGVASEDNYYHWTATIFGPDGTLWEGGIFNLDLVFDDNDSPAKARFATKMFHPHST